MDRGAPILNLNVAGYPSIEVFGVLVARVDDASKSATHLQATVLLNLFRDVYRDVVYLEHLKDDVTSALKGVAFYHTQWAKEVLTAARRSLNQVNSYIESKIPETTQSLLGPKNLSSSASKSKLSDAVKDVTSVAAMQQQLITAHAGLVGAMGLMHQLAIQQSGMAISLQRSAAQGP